MERDIFIDNTERKSSSTIQSSTWSIFTKQIYQQNRFTNYLKSSGKMNMEEKIASSSAESDYHQNKCVQPVIKRCGCVLITIFSWKCHIPKIWRWIYIFQPFWTNCEMSALCWCRVARRPSRGPATHLLRRGWRERNLLSGAHLKTHTGEKPSKGARARGWQGVDPHLGQKAKNTI